MEVDNTRRSNRSSLADEYNAPYALFSSKPYGNHTATAGEKLTNAIVTPNTDDVTLRIDDDANQKPKESLIRRKPINKVKCQTYFRVSFSPSGRGIHAWCGVISLVVVYHMWVIIYRYAFSEINLRTMWIWFMLDYLADFLYIIDMAVSLRTGFLEDGVMQYDTQRMRVHYLNSTHFYLDCLALLPFDFLYLSLGFNSMLRILRLCKVYKFWHFLDRVERHASRPNLMRSAKLVFYYFTILHWNACVFRLVQDFMHSSVDQDIQTALKWNESEATGPLLAKQHYERTYQGNQSEDLSYVSAAYWGMVGLISVGTFRIPNDSSSYIFGIVQGIVGVLLFATILGHVSNIISHVSAAQKEFQAQLDRVKNYLALRRVPTALQERVIDWFDYLWYMNKITDEENVLNSIPDKLKAEIAIQMHLDTLKRVEIFQNTEEGFLSELVLRLRMVLFAPGDFVCRKGEIGKQMFIVNRGTLHVLGDDNTSILATLRAGSYFGELSILNLGQYGNRRTASVRSLGYSDLFRLSKSDLWDVLKDYPKARRKLESHAYKKIRDYKVLSRGNSKSNASSLTPSYGYQPESNGRFAVLPAGRPVTFGRNGDGSDGYGSDPSSISAMICTPRQSPTPPKLLAPKQPEVFLSSVCRSDPGVDQSNTHDPACSFRSNPYSKVNLADIVAATPTYGSKPLTHQGRPEMENSIPHDSIHTKRTSFDAYANPRIHDEKSFMKSRNLSAPTNLAHSFFSKHLESEFTGGFPEAYGSDNTCFRPDYVLNRDFTPMSTLLQSHLKGSLESHTPGDEVDSSDVANRCSKSFKQFSQPNVPLINFEEASSSSTSSPASSYSQRSGWLKSMQSGPTNTINSTVNSNVTWGSNERLCVPKTRVHTPTSYTSSGWSRYSRSPRCQTRESCPNRQCTVCSSCLDASEWELKEQPEELNGNTLLKELKRLQRSVYMLERQNAVLQCNQNTRMSLDNVEQWSGVKTFSPIMEHPRIAWPTSRMTSRVPVRRSASLQVPRYDTNNSNKQQTRPVYQPQINEELRAATSRQSVADGLQFGIAV